MLTIHLYREKNQWHKWPQWLGCLCLGVLIMVLSGCMNDVIAEEGQEDDDITIEDIIDDSQALHIAYDLAPVSLDPHRAHDRVSRDLVRHVYESLVTFDQQLNIQPMLAESYEINETLKTITFELRQGVLFHNGEKMQSHDVVASLKRWATIYADTHPFFKNIKFEAEGDYTVVVYLEKLSMFDLAMFADDTRFAAIMPKELAYRYLSQELPQYIGTGPYQFSEWQEDDVKLTRFASYHSVENLADGLAGNKQATIDHLYFHVVEDDYERVHGLKKGKYHVIQNVPYEHMPTLAFERHIQNQITGSQFPVIMFNQNRLFGDQRLRLALASILNIEELMQTAYRDPNFYDLDVSLTPSSSLWYVDMEDLDPITQDVEYARELIREANYIGEKIHLLTTYDREDLYQLAVSIQQQLRQIGMNIVLDAVDGASFHALLKNPEEYDIAITTMTSSMNPFDPFVMNPTWNHWIEQSHVMEQLENLYETSYEDIDAQIKDLQIELRKDLAFLMLGQKKDVLAYHSQVEGITDFYGGLIFWNTRLEE